MFGEKGRTPLRRLNESPDERQGRLEVGEWAGPGITRKERMQQRAEVSTREKWCVCVFVCVI